MWHFQRMELSIQVVTGLALIAISLVAYPSLVQAGPRYYTYSPPQGRSGGLIPAGPNSANQPVVAGELYVEVGTNPVIHLAHEPRYYGITAIAIQETNKAPCKIELYGKLLDPEMVSYEQLVGTARLRGCDGGKNKSWRQATLDDQPHQFVREIQTCHPAPVAGRNYKVKGLSVGAFTIHEPSGQMIDLPRMPCIDGSTPHCFARPRCGHWGKIATCPSGQIVKAVTVSHYADNDDPPGAVFQIQPHCEIVKRVPLPSTPPTDRRTPKPRLLGSKSLSSN